MTKFLKIKLSGVEDLVDFADFGTFISAVSETLTITHRRLHPERQVRPSYLVRDLQVGSAIALLSPADSGISIFDDYTQSLIAIRAGILPSGKLSNEDLRCYKKLGKVLDSKSSKAEVNDVEIDDVFVANCDRLIESSPSSFGQVVGRLQGVNTRRNVYFLIYPEDQNNGAECHLRGEGLYQPMMGMFDKRVRLTGTVRRNPDGFGVDRVDVLEAELLPNAGETPKLASLAGIWKNDQPFNLRELRAGWQ